MTDSPRERRPGGRSARVRQAVHEALRELIAEQGYRNLTIGQVAARAGVADTSLYRRWGNLESLIMDVVIARIIEESPIPDTGTLQGDVRAFAGKVAHDITGPDGLALLQAVTAAVAAGKTGEEARDRYLRERAHQMETMLDRARTRGEQVPDQGRILDGILAPLYIRVLFGMSPFDDGYLDDLVERALAKR